jgi:AraC-like DNA-binding protein
MKRLPISAKDRAPSGAVPAGHADWRRLATYEPVREYQAAFASATGIPLNLLPPSPGLDGQRAMPAGGEFCVADCLGSGSGQACWCGVRDAEARAAKTLCPVHFTCAAGMTMILTPVTVRGRYLGAVLAGPFAERALDAPPGQQLERGLAEGPPKRDEEALRKVWNQSPATTAGRRHAMTRLTILFAQYLGARAERQLAGERAAMSPLLEKVEKLLAARSLREALSLREAATKVSLSPCHFCRVFKQQTGMTLTQYQTRRRLELAKRLLLEPHRRVSEVAYAAGFESIPHFNRVFRRYAGCSPSQYRRREGTQIQVK